MSIESRFRELYLAGAFDIPFPGSGRTAQRHLKLAEWARQDLPLARLAEAHVDALAILREADRTPRPGLYGVWASQTPGYNLNFVSADTFAQITGAKMFCSGSGIVDRALITVGRQLVDIDLRKHAGRISFDCNDWRTEAFAETNTATALFVDVPVDAVIGKEDWYVERPGFWHGACGPAACWAGGAMGLVDYALQQRRDDAHLRAHLGAMSADVWALECYLEYAGQEIDRGSQDAKNAQRLALTVRHLIETACSDILHRFGRALGPRPLAFDRSMLRLYQEVQLYIRQSHAEHDLEILGQE